MHFCLQRHLKARAVGVGKMRGTVQGVFAALCLGGPAAGDYCGAWVVHLRVSPSVAMGSRSAGGSAGSGYNALASWSSRRAVSLVPHS